MKNEKTPSQQRSYSPELQTQDNLLWWQQNLLIAGSAFSSGIELYGKQDSTTLNRVLEVQKLPQDKRNFVFNMIDMALRDFKVKQAHAS